MLVADRPLTLDSQWKKLEHYVAKGWLANVDLALAKVLLPVTQEAQSCAALICHLAAATRCGHLCVVILEDEVWPHPKELWQSEHVEKECYDDMERMICQGKKELPKALITQVFPNQNLYSPIQTPLCHMGDKFYLQRFWLYETNFLHHCRALLVQNVKPLVNKALVHAKLYAMQKDNTLLKEQAQAIFNACTSPLVIIAGGPGTGKTHTAGQLIRILWDSLEEPQKQTFTIALAAPTGKAAANLQKSLLQAAKGIPALLALQAKTLHRLLDLNDFKNPSSFQKMLNEDLVIIDESSMIDMRMMAALFAAIKPTSRLILLGDNFQLPAVDAGAPFADLIQALSRHQSPIVTHLKVCLRAELKSIVDFAAAVNQGDELLAMSLLASDQAVGIQRLNVDISFPTKAVKAQVCQLIAPYYQSALKLFFCPEAAFKALHSFRVLSPLKNGPFGSIELNSMLLKEMKKSHQPGQPFIAPIMILKNDYHLNVFNGEVGLLVRPYFSFKMEDFDFSRADYVLVQGFDGAIRTIPALLMPSFEYAYCMTVHKSQGSEFDHVALVLPKGSEAFGREVLYTGITRARRRLDLLASNEVLKNTILQRSYRLSGFCERL